MTQLDPLTKIGIMLAIRQLARDNAGAKTPLAALEWALDRKILAPRVGASFDDQDDLILTPYGRELVANFWLAKERKRAAQGKALVRPNARRAHGGVIIGEAKN